MLSPTIILPINLYLQVSSGLHFSLTPPKVCQCINNNQIFPQSGFVPMHDPWVGKSPWRRKWQLTPLSLPAEFHGQGNLVGYSPSGVANSQTQLSTADKANAKGRHTWGPTAVHKREDLQSMMQKFSHGMAPSTERALLPKNLHCNFAESSPCLYHSYYSVATSQGCFTILYGNTLQ